METTTTSPKSHDGAYDTGHLGNKHMIANTRKRKSTEKGRSSLPKEEND